MPPSGRKPPGTATGFNFPEVDYRAHPELYRIGRGEQGVLTVEPYKSELLPLWRFRTPDIAKDSAEALLSFASRSEPRARPTKSRIAAS